MSKPFVSVILPTFGRPGRLKNAIQSIVNQTYENLEIILVDDNPPHSDDRASTRELVEQLQFEDLKYIEREQNGGGAIARNTGISNASGDLITFLDDDDEYLPTKIERQVKHCQLGYDISLCSMQAKKNGYKIKYTADTPVGKTLREMLLSGNVFTPMIMVRKELIVAVGGFSDTPRFQDHVLMIKMLEQNPKVGVVNERLFIHNIHEGNRISYSKKAEVAYAKKQYYESRNFSILTEKEIQIISVRQKLELLWFELANDSISNVWKKFIKYTFYAKSSHERLRTFFFFARYLPSRNNFLKRMWGRGRSYIIAIK